MKKLCLATVALSALLVAPALAADIAARPYTKAPAMMAPIYNWTGFYIGGNVGYITGANEDITTTGQAPLNVGTVASGARPPLVGSSREGFIGGGQIGYNWQWTPNWVLGLEADIQATSTAQSSVVVGTTGLSNTFRNDMEYLGTVRGRLGYTWGQTMLYGTGGFAYARVNNSASFASAGGALAFFGQDRSTRTGYTVGGGIEHMFSPNWSVKAEYLYYELDRSNLAVNLVPGGIGVGTGYNTTVRNDGHIARVGLNYKFSSY